MVNFFQGFREASGMMDIVKKTERVPKQLWFGLPFQIPARKQIKIAGKIFSGPMTFYVDDFDNATVTLKLVRNPLDFTNLDDQDDEIDLDNTNDGEEQKFTITRDTFNQLMSPEIFS